MNIIIHSLSGPHPFEGSVVFGFSFGHCLIKEVAAIQVYGREDVGRCHIISIALNDEKLNVT